MSTLAFGLMMNKVGAVAFVGRKGNKNEKRFRGFKKR